MYKKIGFLIIALALGFTACNNESSSASAKEDTTTASADTNSQKKPLSPRTSTMLPLVIEVSPRNCVVVC